MAKTKAMCIINRTDKLIRIQHEKKHGKGSKNSSTYFDNKMIEEEEMEKQIDDQYRTLNIKAIASAAMAKTKAMCIMYY